MASKAKVKQACASCNEDIVPQASWRFCPKCGSQISLKGEIPRVRKIENLIGLLESLCFRCSRAYALPDPEGCAFHRRDSKRNIEGIPYSKAFVIEKTLQDESFAAYVTVVECPDFRKD